MCLYWRCRGLYVRMCLLLRRFSAYRWQSKPINEFLLAMLRGIHGLILCQRSVSHLVDNYNLVCPAGVDVRHRLRHVMFCIYNILWLSLILCLNLMLLQYGDQAWPSLSFYLCLFLHQQGLNGFLVGWGRFLYEEDVRIVILHNLGIYFRLSAKFYISLKNII